MNRMKLDTYYNLSKMGMDSETKDKLLKEYIETISSLWEVTKEVECEFIEVFEKTNSISIDLMKKIVLSSKQSVSSLEQYKEEGDCIEQLSQAQI